MAPIAVKPIAVRTGPAEWECQACATNPLAPVFRAVQVVLGVLGGLAVLWVAEPRPEFLRASCCRVRCSEIHLHLRCRIRKQIPHCHLDLQVIS